MKICYFGIYDRNYPRNDILMNGMEMNGAEVVECHENWNEKGRYVRLYKKLRALNNDYDIIYCAYPAPVPTILAKLISKKPVVMDAFYGMFDAVVVDRKEIPWYHPRALKLAFLDWLSAVMADYIITDTITHIQYWRKWPFINLKKIHAVHIGANDKVFFPKADVPKDLKHFWISFHGKFIPLHGLEKVVEAARILKDDDSIRFRLIGSGAESKKIKKLIKEYDLKNIEEIERVTPAEINNYMNSADVVLGIFGDTEKAWRVIGNKVYEGMAVRKPLINMDSPVIREIVDDTEMMLVKNTPEEIADAIMRLKNDSSLRESIAEKAYEKASKMYFPKPRGKYMLDLFASFLREMKA